MKWLFFFTILLNAVFWGWYSFLEEKPVQNKESVYGPPISEKIYLLSEEPSVTQQDYMAGVISNESLKNALDNVVESIPDSGLFCAHLEIEREADKEKVVQALETLEWKYQTKKLTGKRVRFWLYIAAPETPEMANRIVKELAAKSIDSFVINRDEMKNRISLGLYSSLNRAEQARQKVQKLSGYDVDVYEHMRNVPIQSINIEQPLDEKIWAEFASRFDLGKMMIKLEKNAC